MALRVQGQLVPNVGARLHVMQVRPVGRSTRTKAVEVNTMATMALPIQTLSADIQVEAARAQQEIVRLRPRFHLIAWVQTRIVNRYCGKAIIAAEELVHTLQGADFAAAEKDFLKEIATDLDRIVSLMDAVVEKGSEMPCEYSHVWRPKFDKLSELASHFDSIAESLHVAADPKASALLAFAVAEQTLAPAAV